MIRHFHDELKKIKEKLFRMGLLVEAAVENSSAALFERNSAKAENVIKQDKDINLYEIEIDELGHEMIALYQPTASDMRLISSILKMTSDLERMGDQSVNIAEKAIVLNQEPPIKPYEDLPQMARATTLMVREVLSAFMSEDADKAKAIMERDDEIDQLNVKIYDDILKIMEKKPETIRAGVSLIMVAHNFERIADLATNIAEDVIYLKRGIDVRHHIRERREDIA